MLHSLKIEERFFHAVAYGNKTFELRKFDRPYKTGDVLELHEIIKKRSTGRCVNVTVSYVLEKYEGIQEGFVILGVQSPSEIYHEAELEI